MDIVNDVSRTTWYKLGTAHKDIIPDYVMNSEPVTKDAASLMPSRQFADDANRLFPLDTPADTWLSAAYFAKNAEEAVPKKAMREYVLGRIKNAAAVFDISEDVEKIVAAVKADSAEKQAEDDDSFYGWPSERKYPMFDSDGVKKAAAYFEENKYLYPRAMRKTIANAIMRKAGEYAVELPDGIRKSAGAGFPSREAIAAELLHRGEMTSDPQVAVAIGSIVEKVATIGADELIKELDKVAELIENADRLSGVAEKYGKGVLSPDELMFDMDPKEAESLISDSVELGKSVFSLKKLAELPETVFSDVLGDAFSERVKTAGKIDPEKLGDELHSLPLPDKNALNAHIRSMCV